MFGVCDTIIYEHIVRLNGMVVCNYIFSFSSINRVGFY